MILLIWGQASLAQDPMNPMRFVTRGSYDNV